MFPICRSLRVMPWRHRGPMESATSWTPSQPCGMQMLTNECVTDKCHARGCNLPIAPAQKKLADTGQFFPPITCYPTHGKRLAQRGDCRILRRCSCRPARSSAGVRRRGTVRQRMGGGNTPSGVSPHPPGGTARLEIGTVASSHAWRHPLSSGPTSVWRQPFLSADQTKSCSELLKLQVRSTYMRNALTGHSNAKAGSVSSEGSACRFTTWPLKGVVGTLGTYPGRGLKTTWE